MCVCSRNVCFLWFDRKLRYMIYKREGSATFCIFCEGHYWCQVRIMSPLFFQRYFWFCDLSSQLKQWLRHQYDHLHKTKTQISLKRKRIFQNGKHYSSLFSKGLHMSINYFYLIGTLNKRDFRFCLWSNENFNLTLFGVCPKPYAHFFLPKHGGT